MNERDRERDRERETERGRERPYHAKGPQHAHDAGGLAADDGGEIVRMQCTQYAQSMRAK